MSSERHPQRQTPQQPQMQPTQAPEAVIFSATTTEHHQEVVGQPQQIPNGTAAFQAPNHQAQQQPLPPRVIRPGDLDPAALDFYASIVAEKNPALAAAIRHQKYDNTMTGGFRRTMSHRVTIGDVVITAGVITAVIFLWEAIAYKADLPRFGLFDPSNPMRAAPAARRA